MPLSEDLLKEKNRISSPNAWLILLDILVLNTSIEINIVRNTEDVTFNGKVYTAFPFEFDFPENTAKGSLPSAEIKVSNVLLAFQTYLEEYDGLVGSTIKTWIVNSAYLADNYADLAVSFRVTGTVSDAQWITFTLGMPSPMVRRFPFYRYIAGHCNWIFSKIINPANPANSECGYIGDLPTCNRTLDDCRNHNNTVRYGGHPGLSRGGIRLV